MKIHLYVTGAPASGAYETMLWLGCSGANGLSPHNPGQSDPGASTADQSVINGIWSKFTGRNVVTVEGHQLTYYNYYNVGVQTAGGLLSGGDGQCGSWTKLLIDILYYEGVGGIQAVEFTPKHESGFLVNNWAFSATGHSGIPDYPYLNTCLGPLSFQMNNAENGYIWRSADVTQSGNGLPAQGNASPASIFGNHQMLKITNALGTTYYDPSYGLTFSSAADFEYRAIAGFFRLKGSTVNGVQIVTYEIEKDPGNEIQESPPTNYGAFPLK